MAAAALVFAAFPLLLLRRRGLRALLMILAAATLISTLSGCSNVYYTLNRVAPGTYTIPITATDTGSNISHTANLTLVVSP